MFNSVFPEFPGTDFQRYNLSWLIKICKKAEETVDHISDEVAKIVQEILGGEGASAFIRDNVVNRIALADDFPGSAFTPGQFVMTKGYHAAGVGTCLYMIETEPRRGAIMINATTFANPVDAHTPEQFGAYCDGLHDDSPAVELAMETGYCILTGNRQYTLASEIDTVNDCILVGNNATFVRAVTTIQPVIKAIGNNIFLTDFNMVDSANAIDNNNCPVVIFEACKNVYMRGVDITTTKKTNWGVTVSCYNLIMDNCHIDTSYQRYEWGDGVHVIKADTVKVANSTFCGSDDAFALVPQGNVGLTAGNIEFSMFTNCTFKSPKYSGLKIGRYKVEESVHEPRNVILNSCSFLNCDRWVTVMSQVGNPTKSDIIFNACIFSGNSSKDNQQPINSVTASDEQGGRHNILFNGCKIIDGDTTRTVGLVNVAAMESITITGCDIDTKGQIIFDSSRSRPSNITIDIDSCNIKHNNNVAARALNNGAINGDVTFINNKIFVTGTLFDEGYFYSYSDDNNFINIVNNFTNRNLIGNLRGPNYTTAGNVIRGTHS